MENVLQVKAENIVANADNDPIMKKNHADDEPIIKKKSLPKSPTIEKTYQKKTQLEHILLRPDTYIGSVEKEEDKIWVFDEETKKMKQRKIVYVPGLYKIFDEILVNAADNKQRDPSMNLLKVVIDKEKGSICVRNNGKGIPVVKHKEHKCFVPELIFGHLLTSSNYDDNQKKTVGGRNGYGAKLANIFSTEFIIETCDSKTGLKYHQKFSNNMSKKTKGRTSKSGKSKDFTQITFKPDFEKFGMENFDDDIIALMKKRVYDIAGIYGRGLKVNLNGEILKLKTFKDYIKLYLKDETPVVTYKTDRWEVAVTASDGHFQQVSFVNSICTIKGGKHVNYITDQVGQSLVKIVKKKNKKVTIKSHHIKNHLWVFVNTLINNPAFDSQTKCTLTTTKAKFGSKCELPVSFMKQVEKSGVIANILAWAEFKQSKDLKKGDGKRKGRLIGIPKLEDANNAGRGKLGKNCTLILTEGDSAKALAVAGFSVVGRDNYGVFPLKGKLLNVRDASTTQMLNNKEIMSLKQIIGLKHGQVYEKTDSLRYGHVMIMTDQDHDGSHIKGLLINFFQFFWPSLLKIEGFLREFITPIVKVTKGRYSQPFYTLPQYEEWKEENENGKGWKIKYYKGLGTSTSKEGREYFEALDQHKIDFEPLDEDDEKMVDLAFGKKNANGRKEWMTNFVEGTYLDQNVDTIKYTDFFNKELILFSRANNIRAIPSIIDGLKPGQRKILFSCFKRKLFKETKVAQLVGYVSEHSAYHHGEMSLSGTIINLAQDFVGSNNLNYLVPAGQFGTRNMGGKDHASSRYIFTQLSAVTRLIFPEDDDNVLKFLDDDGLMVEPEWYVPIFPTVLLNGAQGIGTGWSTNIPQYNPRDLVASMKQLISNGGVHVDNIVPWSMGWTGTMTPANATRTKYDVHGIVEKVDETTVLISELPVQKWTSEYKEKVLDKYLETNKIKDYRNNSTNEKISFHVTMEPDKLLQAEAQGLLSFFKLTGHCNLTNMMVFDPEGMSGSGKIKKYTTVEDMMKRFYVLRLHFYHKRKEFLVDKLTKELNMINNRVRFILAVISGELEIRNRPKVDILNQLANEGYTMFPKEKKKGKSVIEEEEEEEEEDANDGSNIAKMVAGYNYLLSMPLWNLTLEKVEKMRKQKEEKEFELDELCNTSPETLWEVDLDNFLEGLNKFEDNKAKSIKDEEAAARRAKRKKKMKKKRYDDDEDFVPGGGRKKSKAKRKPRAKPKKKAEPIKVEDVKDIKVEIKDVEVDIASNLIKDIEISEVDELPEDDDEIKIPMSSISRMASEMEELDIFPERKLTPLKKGTKGKRKKQVTPLRPVKDVIEEKHRNKKQMTKAQEEKSKTGRGGKKKEKKAKAPRKTKVKKQKKIIESSDEDEWEQEKLHPLQQYQQDLPVPPRSTKRPARRRKVISYADCDDSEEDYFQ